MTRASDHQLELNFEGEREQVAHVPTLPQNQQSASIVYFTLHLHSRRLRKENAKNAKLIEQIASRVRRFK